MEYRNNKNLLNECIYKVLSYIFVFSYLRISTPKKLYTLQISNKALKKMAQLDLTCSNTVYVLILVFLQLWIYSHLVLMFRLIGGVQHTPALSCKWGPLARGHHQHMSLCLDGYLALWAVCSHAMLLWHDIYRNSLNLLFNNESMRQWGESR